MPTLQNVHSFILGVDGADRSLAYWQSLRAFWEDYFHGAGADLQSYSALREIPSFSVIALMNPPSSSLSLFAPPCQTEAPRPIVRSFVQICAGLNPILLVLDQNFSKERIPHFVGTRRLRTQNIGRV